MKPAVRFNFIGLIMLMSANCFTLWQFVSQDGSILQVLWVYWIQSVIIGLVNIVRMLSLPLKSVGNFGIVGNLKPVKTGVEHKNISLLLRIFFVGFFSMHYGTFHLVYGVFLFVFSMSNATVSGIASTSLTMSEVFTGSLAVQAILLNGLFFAVHHLLTFLLERKMVQQSQQPAPSIVQVMGRPYARILPMHLIIIFGPWIAYWLGSSSVFVVFILLKTVTDLGLFLKGSSHPGTINASRYIPHNVSQT